MKKWIALLLCLLTVFPLSSCIAPPLRSDPPDTDSVTTDTPTFSVEKALEIAEAHWGVQNLSYDKATDTQFAILHAGDSAAELEYHRFILLSWVLSGERSAEAKELVVHKHTGNAIVPASLRLVNFGANYAVVRADGGYTYFLFNQAKQTVYIDTAVSQPTFWMPTKHLIKISVPIGENMKQIRAYDYKTGKISKVFDSAYNMSDDGLVVYLGGSPDDRVLIVQNIFDENIFYKEYRLPFAKIDNPVESASINFDRLSIRYYREDGTKVATILPVAETPSDFFTDYKSVLALTDQILTLIPQYDSQADYLHAFGLTEGTRDAEWFSALFTALLASYPKTEGRDLRQTMGYAVKDLNQDGVYELIFLRNDYEIQAIFTEVDGKPILLAHFDSPAKCFLDESGAIHTRESGNGTDRYAVYRIADGTGKLETVADFGLDGATEPLYSKTVNGERIAISKAEYESLLKEHWDILGERTPAEYTRDFARIRFTAVPGKYSTAFLTAHFDNYEDVVADAAPMGEAELASLKTQPVIAMYRGLIDSYRISCKEQCAKTTHFSLVDINGDGVRDLLLRTTEEVIGILYQSIEEKDPKIFFLGNHYGILDNGLRFGCGYSLEWDLWDVFLGKLTEHSTVSSAYNIDKPNASYYAGGKLTKEAWLEDLRARELRHVYWYPFEEEVIQTYLPCEEPLPFTSRTYSSYDSLLRVIYHLTDSYNLRKMEPSVEGKLEILYDCSTQEKYEKYLDLKELVFRMYPKALGASSPAEDAIGYAFRDLNGDGIEELMLFSGNGCELGAVFTLVNGKPTRAPLSDYSFEDLPRHPQLAYWETTVGIDVLPLFPESDHFDYSKPSDDSDSKPPVGGK